MTSVRPEYEVVSPAGRRVTETIPLATPLTSLEGKIIGFAWNRFANGPVLADAFIDLLGKRFKGTKFVKLPPGKGLQWGQDFDKSVGKVAKEAGVDAVIVVVGG